MMAYLAAFLEGIVTFLSPCLLPLLPVYLAFFAGNGAKGGEGASLVSTLMSACAFVVGFSAPFILMGASAGALGSVLASHRRLLEVTCGVVVIVLGLSYLGVLKVNFFQRMARSGQTSRREGPVGALLLGVAFAVGWTPCVGTFLASALSLAASTGSALQGVAMLGCYSLGLGVPFVLCAVLIDQLEGALAWVKSHYDIVERVSGVALVVFGLLMVVGISFG